MKKTVRKSLSLLLVLAMLLAQFLAAAPLQIEAEAANVSTLTTADTDVQNGVTLHCWNWSYANILANLDTIAKQGYTAIQVSPIQQAKQPTMGGPVNDWWAFYQPADFAIDNTGVNAMGTKAEFMNLCETAHEYGIYVIVDVVANHMAADYNYSRSPAIIADIRNDNSCWHQKNSNIWNYSDRANITQYDLDSVLDLNTGSKKVQNYVLNYLKELIDAGADGFRFDAVKHIETPDDNAAIASDFWPTVVGGAEAYAESKGVDIYCYGELLDHPDDVNGLPDSAYAKYYSITDNVWGNNVRDAVVAGGNASSFGSTYHKNVSADQLVLWAESHDTYAGGNSGSVSEANINKTWALVAARADAMSLYLSRTTGFTPPNALGSAYLSGWNAAEVAAVNKFHKAFVGQSEYVANSGSIAYVERGTSGVVLVNVGGNGTSVSVPANRMAAGTYKDQITGNTFTVSGGKITGTIGSSGIAVVYNVASCSHSSHNIAGLCSNCLTAVSHKYSGGVCSCGAKQKTSGTCAHTEHRFNGVCRNCAATVGHTYENGLCTVCGVEKPVDTFAYYLNGYINGTNVNDVNETYRFKDGKLTFTSSVDAYVSVRTYNGIFYQTTPDQQYNQTVTLHNASMGGNNSQMKVPGGKTVTLYLQSNYNGTYTLSYAEGGIVDTPTGSASDYYLVGYINGADHGCEGDSANLGNYKFVNGKLTATFNQDSYVFVKNGDNSKWLLADSYCTDTTCTFSTGKTEKMLVPGGVELTFTLTENADGSVTVSYTTGSTGGDVGGDDGETVTVYYDNSTTKWSKVNAYSWNTSGATNGEWPGTAMTLVEGNIYSIKVPASATSIIFNDGTSQTEDLTIPTGKNLYTGSGWSTYTPAEVTTSTIYVDVTGSGWSKVNVYTWDASGNATTGAWPGSAMTKVSGNVYSYEVPSNATSIIFNDGTNQTIDLTIPTDGKDLYTYTANDWSTYATECSHSYTAKVTVAAGCEQNGLKTYTCSKCGATYTESIPATGHSYTSKVTAPTCEAQGYTTHTCANCADSYKDTYVAATGHSYTSKVTTAATCTKAGVKTFTCSKCGDSYTESIAATGHSYTSKVTTAATCTKAGVKTYTCSKCGDSYTESIAATGHSYVNGTCSACGAVDPNCSHSYTGSVTTAATCTKAGVKTYTCSKCGDSYTEAIAATGHSYTSKVTTAAGCTTTGVKTYTCSKCSASYTEGIPATGHSYSGGTCTACGAAEPKEACYKLVTELSDITSGGDFIIAVKNGDTYRAMGTTMANMTINAVDVTVDGDVASGAPVITLKAADGGVIVNVDGSDVTFGTSGILVVKKGTNGFTVTSKDVSFYGILYNIPNDQFAITLASNASNSNYLSEALFFKYTEETTECEHTYTSSITTAATCDKAGVKTYTCSKCGDSYTEAIAAIGHSYTSSITTAATCDKAGVKTFTCSKCGDSYTEAIPATGHNFVNGTCTSCGAEDPNASTETVYYLVGWINGADHGCNDDYENMGNYKLENGTLTTSFESDSYVFVKTEGNGKWLLANAYCEDTTCTFVEGATEKMFVPGGVTVTFTLTENADGSVTLSYTTASTDPSTAPTIGLKYPTVSFEDMILMNVYYSATDLEDVVEMGLVTYTTKPATPSVDTADQVIPGYAWSESDGFYFSTTAGIAPKDLGDTIHFAVYYKLADGTYGYTKVIGYSPKTYALGQLNTGSAEMKALVVAMLNYGAAAQTYFGYKTDSLMNATLTSAQKALVADYSSSMIATVTQASGTKLGTFVNDNTYTKRYPTITFEGAFCINYYFQPSLAVKGDVTMYIWSLEDFNAASVLTKANATKAVKMELTETGEYLGVVDGIAAKHLDKAAYVSFVYSDGTTEHCGGVLGYTIGMYCKSQASKTGTLADLAKACAVYGYYAKQLFN